MIHVIGGCYEEICLSPPIRQFYGSGGRAAAALATDESILELHSFVSPGAQAAVQRLAALSGFDVKPSPSTQEISFAYINPVFRPVIDPPPPSLAQAGTIRLKEDIILVFGMLEGHATVVGDTVVYDPQNGARPLSFSETGSEAKRLAIICNRGEAAKLSGTWGAEAAKIIRAKENAEVVILKDSVNGAYVATRGSLEHVPAYFANSVFSIGSGDVFAAAFTRAWAMRDMPARDAADWASRAVAHYVGTRQERLAADEALNNMKAVSLAPGQIYLAAPFFTMADRWLLEETRALFMAMDLKVFSPLHEVGYGPAADVAKADLNGLESSDRVFAMVSRADPGTLFEVGYARNLGKPVYVYCELSAGIDCKMLTGSGCRLFPDYATAIYATAWGI